MKIYLFLCVTFNQMVNFMEELTTEQKILDAARQVFVKKGMVGARMQEIADEAGINKALLHYYYKTKDKLFEAVFIEIFTGFFGSVGKMLTSDASVKDKVMLFVDSYIDVIAANPFVPQFIINEINRDPQMLLKLMSSSGFDPKILLALYSNELDKQQLDVRHFIVSMMGLCVFPFVARPLIEIVYFDNNNEAYDKFLSERKEFVKDIMLKYIEK